MNISVLGSGSWGTALACLLSDNGHDVKLWSFDAKEASSINENRENKVYLPGVEIPPSLTVLSDKAQALSNCEMVVNVVPSKFVRSTMEAFKGIIPENSIIVNAAKGIEEGSYKMLSQVISEVYPESSVAVLSGPSHAEEVGRKIPTTVVASSKNLEIANIVQDVFMNEYFRVYTNTDLTGVELGGALKNVVALAAGISDGMGFGDNTKAALMTRGIKEISQLGSAMGAEINTFFGLSGIGDLIVTCTSMHSRNRRAGILLGQGKSLEDTLTEIHQVVEGVNTSNAAYELSLKYNVDMPITAEINAVLNHGKDPKKAVYDLMTRDKKQEHSSEDTFGGRLMWQ